MEEELCEAALKWLEDSGGLASLHSALMARAALPKPHRIFSAPVHVNIMDLRQINGEKLVFDCEFLGRLIIFKLITNFELQILLL